MTAILRLILRYWGKGPRTPLEPAAWHPLVLHAFDVAAVADALMTVCSRWLERVAAALSLSPADARRLVLWLVVLHDLGKFAGNFQIRVAELAALLGFSPRDYGSPARHDAVGLAMAEVLLDALHERTVARVSPALEESHLLTLLSATTGHHGMPRTGAGVMSNECWNAAQLADARDFADATWAFFGADEIACVPDATIDGTAFNAATWDIAGLTIAADWLGSNTEWFPYASTDATQPGARAAPKTDDELRDYWRDAQQRAAVAINASGLCRAAATPFDVKHVVGDYVMRPAQRAAADLALPTGGSLTILEDQTGSGKTEAALIVLHRL
ncbi:MAG TPA: CRISPR-associated endonuclease Cas3'', partial [Tahibacter sp.]|nr:CRISPR-associated endonuclease Cas3'' [Tahibacter sp.]